MPIDDEIPPPSLDLPEQMSESLPDAIRAAQKLAKACDYAAATEQYRLITEALSYQQNPDIRYLGAYIEAGNLHLKKQEPEQALAFYRTYLQGGAAPSKVGYVYCQMAAATLQSGDLERTLHYYQQALQSGLSGSAAAQVHYRRARLFQQLKQSRAAIQAYQQALIDLDNPPLRSRCHYALGKLWQAQKDNDQAAHAYEQATDLSVPEQQAQRYFQLGVIYTAQQRFDDAEQMLDQALAAYCEQDQVFWQAMTYLKKSMLALIQKQLEQVVTLAEAAIAVLGDHQEPSVLITAYDLIAEVYKYQRRHSEAEAWFARSRALKALQTED